MPKPLVLTPGGYRPVSQEQRRVVRDSLPGGQVGMGVYNLEGTAIMPPTNMNEGSGALSWLVGDVDGKGQAEVIQPWDNGGRLGMIVYFWNESVIGTLGPDVNQGSGALSWLVGDVDGKGQDEIIQLWDNGGQLGMIVYKWNGNAMETAGTPSSDVGEGSGALSWLVGDVDGDEQDEIIQPWDNGGRLGMIIYKWNGNAMAPIGTLGPDVNQGSGALSWLVGDVDGDGQDEIIQLWDNGGRLGMIVYKWIGGAMETTGTPSSDVGEGSGALSWLAGDVDNDGQDEIIQPWDNGGQLGMIVYKWNKIATPPTMQVWSAESDMNEGSGANSWLNGRHGAEIIQIWGDDNAARFEMIVYGWNEETSSTDPFNPFNKMKVIPGEVPLNAPFNTMSWLVGDVNNDQTKEIIQVFFLGAVG
jgi:hypothetical protein